ncbi:MAG: glycosyltransferase family 4 protein [Candidatus Heimdallarchaeota archaeon]|nr:glycosyltransferase family 4 protein [Candidatus Heimdallarchaeota archaeon]
MVYKTVKVVPNGVNTNQFRIFDKKMQKKWIEHNFNVNLSSDLNIIYVGRFSREKGVKYLIESLKYLAPTTKLFLVGDGLEKDELSKLVVDLGFVNNVVFLGEILHENLPNLLNAMDIFVLPSIGMEGFSNSMLEAMACGLPVVTTTIGAGPDVIIEDVGYVVETENSKQLADGIMKSINLDRDVIRNYIETNFSFDVVADQVYDMYSHLCGKDVEKICFCSLYTPPFQLSGAGMQVHELSKQLSKLCNVSIISTGMGGHRDEFIDGIHYYRVKYIKGEALSRFCYALLGTLRGMSLDKFDIVDGRNWEGGLISVFLSNYKGSKSVISFRGEGAVEGPCIKNWINRYIANRVDLMTATDKKTAYKVVSILKRFKGDC